MRRPLYFGCVRQAGHYWWTPNERGALVPAHGSAGPFERLPIDGSFAPPLDDEPEGVANLVHLSVHSGRRYPYTVLAFWDRSVDRRGACNSAFALPGTLSFAQAMEQARAAFPAIWQRFTFPIVEWQRPVAAPARPEPQEAAVEPVEKLAVVAAGIIGHLTAGATVHISKAALKAATLAKLEHAPDGTTTIAPGDETVAQYFAREAVACHRCSGWTLHSDELERCVCTTPLTTPLPPSREPQPSCESHGETEPCRRCVKGEAAASAERRAS